MSTFTAARLDGSGTPKPIVAKVETLVSVKAEPAVEISKDVGGLSGAAVMATASSGSGAVKDEPNKMASADVIQTSGAYCSREENFKREVRAEIGS